MRIGGGLEEDGEGLEDEVSIDFRQMFVDCRRFQPMFGGMGSVWPWDGGGGGTQEPAATSQLSYVVETV